MICVVISILINLEKFNTVVTLWQIDTSPFVVHYSQIHCIVEPALCKKMINIQWKDISCLKYATNEVKNLEETSKFRVAFMESKYTTLVDHGVPFSVSLHAVTGTRVSTATSSLDCQTLPWWFIYLLLLALPGFNKSKPPRQQKKMKKNEIYSNMYLQSMLQSMYWSHNEA